MAQSEPGDGENKADKDSSQERFLHSLEAAETKPSNRHSSSLEGKSPDKSFGKRTGIGRRSVLKTIGLAGSAILGASNVPGEASAKQYSSSSPGPSVLYEPLATPPQLENSGVWKADPLMVSGSDAYVEGEYLYQDFIYDDYGANTTDLDGQVSPSPEPDDNNPMTGDVVYPTDSETYRHNAADLLEVRATPVSKGVKYRITLNTMVEPDSAGIAIGIDTDRDSRTGTDQWGYGIGKLGDLGLEHVLVTWGTGAELNGTPLDPKQYDVSKDRNQIEVTLPIDPDQETWRHYLGVGLFDTDEKKFKQVKNEPDQNSPGGAHDKNPPPLFNIGFRFDEPFGSPHPDPETIEEQIEEGTASEGQGFIGHGNYREHGQAKALEQRDISDFHADIDFDKLKNREVDRNVPTSGLINRLYASHFDLGEGVEPIADSLRNRIQPYSVYIPESYDPEIPTSLSIHLHSLGSTYQEFGVRSPNLYRQLGEQRDTIVLTPEGRGPEGWYHDEAELDVFEAWNDLAANYNVDFDRVTLSGYSMGAFGAFRLGALYPDLFGKVFTVAGGAHDFYEASTDRYLDNFQNLPVLMWNGTNDELVPAPIYTATEQNLRERGYRHELDLFTGFDHFTFGLYDQWGPARDFLEGTTVPRSPAEITYRVLPEFDNERFGLVHDEAYWLSDLRVVSEAQDGFINARSLASGEAEPVSVDYEREGTEPAPHVKRGTSWKEPLTDPPAENALTIELERIRSATVWVDDAGLNVDKPIEIRAGSTHEATILFSTEKKQESVTVPAGESTQTVEL